LNAFIFELVGRMPTGQRPRWRRVTEYSSPTGYSGFDIDLVKWLGKELGFTPVFVELKTKERIDRLVSGDVRLVVANFSITEERKNTIAFAGPYFYDHEGLFAWKGVATTVEDVRGKTICVPKSSTSETRLSENYHVITEDRIEQCFDKLSNTDDPTLFVSTDRSILQAYASHRGLSKFSTDLIAKEREEYGIGLRKDDRDLCKRLTERLREYLRSQWDSAYAANLQGVSDQQEHKPDSSMVQDC
jgi:glutamate transport system substrate-binding protein